MVGLGRLGQMMSWKINCKPKKCQCSFNKYLLKDSCILQSVLRSGSIDTNMVLTFRIAYSSAIIIIIITKNFESNKIWERLNF